MAHINRRYIDKHWLLFVMRGVLAAGFGCFMLFGTQEDLSCIIAMISIFLLAMGIVDAVGALYSSLNKRGWINSVIDALIDVIAAVLLLFVTNQSMINSLIVISLYVVISGIIDIFHGFFSTVDPTDRFIRTVAGACGCIMGAVILNAGNFELTVFVRFFGAYMLIVGVTSMIYGVHNRSQKEEDLIARKESAEAAAAKRLAKRASTPAKTTTRSTKSTKSKNVKKTSSKKRK
ncbi:DUF308 domain-containing protein [Candidatus Saccharibacteria bacterium]|nr:DUF308 domain-containing protein [Candidatus Saccharibacteria bacterium]